MPMSLRIPHEKEEILKKKAIESGKSKSALVIEALDEKLGIIKSRQHLIRELSGFLSPEDADELRKNTEVFSHINNGDWL